MTTTVISLAPHTTAASRYTVQTRLAFTPPTPPNSLECRQFSDHTISHVRHLSRTHQHEKVPQRSWLLFHRDRTTTTESYPLASTPWPAHLARTLLMSFVSPTTTLQAVCHFLRPPTHHARTVTPSVRNIIASLGHPPPVVILAA